MNIGQTLDTDRVRTLILSLCGSTEGDDRCGPAWKREAGENRTSPSFAMWAYSEYGHY